MFPNFVKGSEKGGALRIIIQSEGKEIPTSYGIQSVVINKEVNKISSAKIVIFDGNAALQDFEISNLKTFEPGTEIEIHAARGDGDEKKIFKGIVIKNAVRNRPGRYSVFEIECRDEAVKLTVGRKNAYYSGAAPVLDSSIITKIIKNAGVSVGLIEPTTVMHKNLIQYFATDWDYILSRAEANSKVVLVDDGKVSMLEPKVAGLPVLSLAYGQTLFDFDAEIDARTQFSTIMSRSWDPATNKIVEEKSKSLSPVSLGEQGNLSSKKLAGVIGLDAYLEQHSGMLKKDELKAWANAHALKSKLSKVKGSVKVVGSGAIKPGNLIALGGMGDRFNGNAYVSGVRHELSDGLWYSVIKFGLDFNWYSNQEDIVDYPAAGLLPGVRGLQIGVVTKINGDPDGDDRIQVRLPLVDEGEDGIWARMTQTDAGKDRGVIFHPEEGDEVIVGFLNEDPRYPIILGTVFSGKYPSPITATADNTEKGIITKGKLKLIFNDEVKSVTIETPNANKLIITDEDDSITLQDKNGNKIIMGSDGITIESAKDLSVKATGDLTLEGANVKLTSSSGDVAIEAAANAEIKGGAQTNISGSIVKIN